MLFCRAEPFSKHFLLSNLTKIFFWVGSVWVPDRTQKDRILSGQNTKGNWIKVEWVRAKVRVRVRGCSADLIFCKKILQILPKELLRAQLLTKIFFWVGSDWVPDRTQKDRIFSGQNTKGYWIKIFSPFDVRLSEEFVLGPLYFAKWNFEYFPKSS